MSTDFRGHTCGECAWYMEGMYCRRVAWGILDQTMMHGDHTPPGWIGTVAPTTPACPAFVPIAKPEPSVTSYWMGEPLSVNETRAMEGELPFKEAKTCPKCGTTQTPKLNIAQCDGIHPTAYSFHCVCCGHRTHYVNHSDALADFYKPIEKETAT